MNSFRFVSNILPKTIGKNIGYGGDVYLMVNKRGFAVTGRHSKNVASKKNALDAAKTKLYARLGIKILMVLEYFYLEMI